LWESLSQSDNIRLDQPDSRARGCKDAAWPPQKLKLFGEPLLLEGEDRAAYDGLLSRLYEAVAPAEMWRSGVRSARRNIEEPSMSKLPTSAPFCEQNFARLSAYPWGLCPACNDMK